MQGMMSELQPQQSAGSPQGFNGVVSFEGNPIQVTNSKATVGGKTYVVSDDGRFVVNDKRELMGIIQNGKFVEASPEVLDQLKQAGILG